MNKQLLVASMRRRLNQLNKEKESVNYIGMVSNVSRREEILYWINKITKAPRGKYGKR